jgi:hypothetical protein
LSYAVPFKRRDELKNVIQREVLYNSLPASGIYEKTLLLAVFLLTLPREGEIQVLGVPPRKKIGQFVV